MIAGPKLAYAALRSHRWSALLLVLVFAAASASAATGLAARSALSAPWDEIFAATNGAHVRVTAATSDKAQAVAETIPGVVESDAGRAMMFGTLRTDNGEHAIALFVDSEPPRLDVPLVLEGLAGHGLRLEHTHAEALDLQVGDAVGLQRPDGSWAEVSVVAVVASSATPPFPQRVPGLGFITEEDRIALGLGPTNAAMLSVRVSDPAQAAAWSADRLGSHEVEISSWSDVRQSVISEGRAYSVILESFSVLLLACATVLVALTIGGRVAVDRRFYTLLAAGGATPAQIAGVASIEHAIGAAAGAALGVGVAVLGAGPVLAGAGPNLGASRPGVGWADAGTVGLVVVATASVLAWAAGYVNARRTADRAASPTHSTMGAWALDTTLPLGPAVGLKDAFGRPLRAVLSATVVGLAVMAAVAALNMEATFSADASLPAAAAADGAPAATGPDGAPALPEIASSAPVDDATRLRPLVYGLEGLLAVVAASALGLAAVLDARERSAESAALLAAGFTPLQLAAARATSTGVSAALGAIVGVPAGIAFFLAAYGASNGSTNGASTANLALLLAAGVFGVLMAAQLAWLAATATARSRPLADALRFE